MLFYIMNAAILIKSRVIVFLGKVSLRYKQDGVACKLLWKGFTAYTLCIQFCFCMFAISFYFVICVII